MRFLVDECTGSAVARWLLSQSHVVFSVYDNARGMSDEDILVKAASENWIIVTNDKDFGDKIYRDRFPHRGVILLRLQNERASQKIAALQGLLSRYADLLSDCFVVVSDSSVRFARRQPR